ncbi:zinc finger, PMZ-type containing protein, partial [Tanacetum coccineum]
NLITDFTVNLHHDGYFISNPLKYVHGLLKLIDDIQFEEMLVGELYKVVSRLLPNHPRCLYYYVSSTILTRGIRELKTEKDMEDFIKLGYKNGTEVDLYTEFNGYDVMDMISNDYLFEPDETLVDPDYESEDLDYDPKNIDFHTEGTRDNLIPPLTGKYILEEEDLDDDLLDAKSESNSLLVYCGRDVELGRCASRRGLIKKKKKKLVEESEKMKGKKVAEESDNYMKDDIREKFMVDVSLGQCKRAKHYALFEHNRGLIEHYGKLWEHKQAVLESNPGSTFHVDVSEDGKNYFHRCASFENGISESFNGQILSARGKPIITMLEDIRVYIMQRNWQMNKKASECNDRITTLIRKHLEELKTKQRKWQVLASGYHVFEVRKRDEAFRVNLISNTCDCRPWNLSGVPCVHAVAAFLHVKLNPDDGVSDWYSQSKWFDSYRFSIKLVYRSKMWKTTINTPPLPLKIKIMLGRPRKNRILHIYCKLQLKKVKPIGTQDQGKDLRS